MPRFNYLYYQYQNGVSYSAADVLDLKRIDPLNSAHIDGEVAAQRSRHMLADYSYSAMVAELPAKEVSLDTST